MLDPQKPDPRIEQFVRQAGAELETSLREAGSTLPPGVTGEQLVRSVVDDMQRELLSDPTNERVKLWQPHVDRIIRELEANCPEGARTQSFRQRWSQESPSGSASNKPDERSVASLAVSPQSNKRLSMPEEN